MGSSNCDTCAYNVYDEEDECYYCEVNMDEDERVRELQFSLGLYTTLQSP